MRLLLLCSLVLLLGCMPMPRPAAAPSATVSPTPAPSVTALPSATRVKASATPEVCVVVGGTVNVRSGPGMNYSVITVVREDDRLIVLGTSQDGWQAVMTPQNKAGYFFTRRWCK